VRDIQRDDTAGTEVPVSDLSQEVNPKVRGAVMKVKIKSTGDVVDIVATADTFLMIMCGLVEQVKPEPYTRRPVGNGIAKWRVAKPEFGQIAFPSIRVHCDTCKTEQAFSENRTLNQSTGRVSPSTMGKAIFHHCKKQETVPSDILKEYEAELLRGFTTSEAL
jgi:hypothetical protein